MPPHVPGPDPHDHAAPSDASLGWDRLTEQERRRQLEAMDPDDLRSMAASQPVIEQAKGVLMGCYGCDAAAAFAILVRLASTRNAKLRDVAALLVEAVTTPTGSGPGPGTSPCQGVRRILEGDRSSTRGGRT